MAQVRIRIEADPVNDPWWRYHGKDIDDPLDKCFWETEPDKVIGTTRSWEPFRHSQTVDLPPGEHYVEYGNSADAGYYWKARIYINDELKAEGNVDRHNHLKATFRVEEAPPPPAPPAPPGVPTIPAIPIEWIIAGIAGITVLAGIVSYAMTRGGPSR